MVGSHQSQIGFLATQHLLDLGHRRIGIIIGPRHRRVVQSRMRGYQRALETAHVAFTSELVEEGDWEVEGGYFAARRLLERAPDLSAIFVQNDTMAVGVLSALHGIGRRVPADCSVIGCDDIPLAAYTIPALTTIHLPFYETGEIAMRVLLEAIAGQTHEQQLVSPPVYLVQRASTDLRENTQKGNLNGSN